MCVGGWVARRLATPPIGGHLTPRRTTVAFIISLCSSVSYLTPTCCSLALHLFCRRWAVAESVVLPYSCVCVSECDCVGSTNVFVCVAVRAPPCPKRHRLWPTRFTRKSAAKPTAMQPPRSTQRLSSTAPLTCPSRWTLFRSTVSKCPSPNHLMAWSCVPPTPPHGAVVAARSGSLHTAPSPHCDAVHWQHEHHRTRSRPFAPPDDVVIDSASAAASKPSSCRA
jgi:hypothetical protein